MLARGPLLCVLALALFSAVPTVALDTPLEGIPLPRAVTSMEHKLGVNDNELPGGKHSVDKGQFALSTYDQSILAGGPPISGSGPTAGPPPAPAHAATAPEASYSYSQPVYAPAPAYSYGQQPAYAQPQPTYAYPQYQGYPAYQQSAYQFPQQQQYAYPQYAQQGQYAYPQYQQQQQQQLQPMQQGVAGANYYDYSQANGALGGANSDIASAAAFTDKGTNQYSNLGWHPTLEREMGVHKSARNKGPRFALSGQLKGMKNLAKPHLTITPSVDPRQVSVAAQKLEKAQALLRVSVAKGLKLKSGRDSRIALGRRHQDPCSTLACERARTDGGRHAMTQNREQTLKTSLAKHAIGGLDANNPLFHDPKPPSPHPPPAHLTPQQTAEQEKQTAHQTFENRFNALAKQGDTLSPSPHPPHTPPHNRGSENGHRETPSARAQRRVQRMHATASTHGHGGAASEGAQDAQGGDTGGSEQRISVAHERLAAKARHGQGLAAMAHENHHAFHFPAYMVKDSADAHDQGVLMGPNGEPRMKKIGADSSIAMTILIVIFLGLLAMALMLGCMHARKERKRNEMVALSGFVDE